jgi:beta-lactamase regulating signal transducer with metallopeptidase domain
VPEDDQDRRREGGTMNVSWVNPDVGLLAASQFADFLLKTMAEWLLCLLLARLLLAAKTRFNLWFAMMLAFVVQWVWMVAAIVRGASLKLAAAPNHVASATAAGGAAGRLIAVSDGLAEMLSRALAVLMICYAAGIAWRMLGTVAARARLVQAMRYKRSPNAGMASSFEEALRKIPTAADRGCELWMLPGLASPATLGWWRPRVLAPPMCESLAPPELEAVFWHELKHVERRDVLWNAIARSCRNVVWFHPCVHHAFLRLNAERELACDAAVVREHPQSRDAYASCLVRFARNRDLTAATAEARIQMASAAGLLAKRLESILTETCGLSRTSRSGRMAAGAALVGAMAVAVPALNIVFAAVMAAPVAAVPATPLRAMSVERRLAGSRLVSHTAEGSSAASTLSARFAAGAIEHDEALAAEHRAGMGVLTESTEMDDDRGAGGATATEDQNGAMNRSRPGSQAAPTWTAVAIDAAERMGPMMGHDHDSDDRH